MIRIVATGDHHFHEGTRWTECLRVHDWIADLVERERPDLVATGGDLFEARSTHRERAAAAAWLQRCAAVCSVIATRGNHDEHLALFGELRAAHPIIAEDAARVHVVETRSGPVAVAAVAWPSKGEMLARVADAGLEESDGRARDALRAVLRGLGQQLATHDGPRVLLGHFMVDGSVAANGQPLIGMPLNVGLDDLGLARADVTIMAHIHRAQEWTYEGRPILYTGSPYRCNYGEGDEKSVALITIDGRAVTVERVPTPATRMLLVEGEYVDNDCGYEPRDVRSIVLHTARLVVRDAEIRLRYLVEAHEREPARASAEAWRRRWLGDGAVSVKLDEQVVATSTARVPEIATAVTLADKLRVLHARDGVQADASARVIALAGELEEEAARE